MPSNVPTPSSRNINSTMTSGQKRNPAAPSSKTQNSFGVVKKQLSGTAPGTAAKAKVK